MTTVLATAHPNIALVKYWGKQKTEGNIPAVPSLSITLDTLRSTTEISESTNDRFLLDGEERSGDRQDTKLARFLAYLRLNKDVPPLHIDSSNNFPTAAGLASSASGFAALVTAIDALCELDLSTGQKSELARVGSASAARSILGGFVGLRAPKFRAEQVAEAPHWPLHVVVAITDASQKSVSSTDGMNISAETSPFYPAWLSSAATDYNHAHRAVEERDFAQLAYVSEHSCLKMHAVMQSSQPALLYWNAASVACMHEVRTLRNEGIDVFFTMDAGPQIKAVCTNESVATVASRLSAVPGVLRTETVALGGAATCKR